MAPSTHSPSPIPMEAPALPQQDARALSMAHHPTAATTVSGVANFLDVVRLLTGPWRVDDPTEFAAAMTGATLIAGHPVLDLAEPAGYSPDPWSIRAFAAWRALLGGLAERSDLKVACVAAEHHGWRIAEGRAKAPAAGAHVECFAVAHLEAPRGHSWVLLVAGDGHGGVASIARAVLGSPRPRCCLPPASWARPGLDRLARRFWSAAGGDAAPAETTGVVVPFRSPV
jgi:hypothetical protein